MGRVSDAVPAAREEAGDVSALAGVTQGAHRHTREIDGFRFTEAKYSGGDSFPRHVHRYPSLTINLDGAFVEVFDAAAPVMGRGDVLIKPSLAAHENRYSASGARCLIVEILPSGLDSLGPAQRIFSEVCYLPATTLGVWSRQVGREFQCDDAASTVALQALLLGFVARHARHRLGGRDPESTLVQALAIIDAGYKGSLSIRGIAARVGVTPGHLARAFRERYGTSPGAHIKGLRVDYVKELLCKTSYPLSQIALEAGFSDQSHMTRVFKMQEGWTPGVYRKRLRGR